MTHQLQLDTQHISADLIADGTGRANKVEIVLIEANDSETNDTNRTSTGFLISHRYLGWPFNRDDCTACSLQPIEIEPNPSELLFLTCFFSKRSRPFSWLSTASDYYCDLWRGFVFDISYWRASRPRPGRDASWFGLSSAFCPAKVFDRAASLRQLQRCNGHFPRQLVRKCESITRRFVWINRPSVANELKRSGIMKSNHFFFTFS